MDGDPLPTPSPSALAGYLDSANRSAIDFRCGLLAYGSQSMVCVVDPDAVAHVTTLDGHRAKVTLVRWAPRPRGVVPHRCSDAVAPWLHAGCAAFAGICLG